MSLGKMDDGEITPLDLVEEMLRLYDARDAEGFGKLVESYASYRFTGRGNGRERILAKELAKIELDCIAEIADETLALGTPEAAVVAIRERFSEGIGPLRQFYRSVAVYTPREG